MIDSPPKWALDSALTDARAPACLVAPGVSYSATGPLFSSSSKFGHGGARANSGGARPNSGGARPNSGGARAGSGGARPGSGPKPRVHHPVPPNVLAWYCVRTGHGAETLAAKELGLAGFDVLAPTEWKPAEPARRYTNGSIRPARPDRVVPLFRRYVFAAFTRDDPSWGQIINLPGVEYIVSAGDVPLAMPEWAVGLIRSLCWVNGCQYPDGVDPHDLHAPMPLAAGSAVQFVSGPLVDRKVICAWSDGRRVEFLMSIFGREVPVTVKQSSVEGV